MIGDPDPSVVHVPVNDMTYQQACDFNELFESEEGRDKLLNWLLHNDPLVQSAYKMAGECCKATGNIEKAVIIVLANAIKNRSL